MDFESLSDNVKIALAACATILILTLLCGLTLVVRWNIDSNQKEIEAMAAAGLVQRVVVVDSSSNRTIWVKPETPVNELVARPQ